MNHGLSRLCLGVTVGMISIGVASAWAQQPQQQQPQLQPTGVQLQPPPNLGGAGVRLGTVSPGQALPGQVSPGRGTGQVSPGQSPAGAVNPGQWAGGVVSPGQASAGQANPSQSSLGTVNPGQGSAGVNLGERQGVVDPGFANGSSSISQRLFGGAAGNAVVIGGATSVSAEVAGGVESTPELERRLEAARNLPPELQKEAVLDVIRRTIIQQNAMAQATELQRQKLARTTLASKPAPKAEKKDGSIWIRGSALKAAGEPAK